MAILDIYIFFYKVAVRGNTALFIYHSGISRGGFFEGEGGRVKLFYSEEGGFFEGAFSKEHFKGWNLFFRGGVRGRAFHFCSGDVFI